MDRDQCLRKHAEILTGKPDSEFYDFEGSIQKEYMAIFEKTL